MFNFFMILLNIIILIAGYFIIKNRIEKRLINKEIIDKIKKEINSIMIQLNEATINNINLIEEKLKGLDKTIVLASKKQAGLKIEKNRPKDDLSLFDLEKNNKLNNFTYSPEKIVNQSQKTSEKIMNDVIEKLKTKTLDDEMTDLSIEEKVSFLLAKNYDLPEIQKKLGLSSGEMELIYNMASLKRN